MTRVLGTIVLLVGIVAAIGFWRGWFVAQSSNSANHSNVDVTVDKNAIRQDETKMQNAGEAVKQKLSSSTSP